MSTNANTTEGFLKNLLTTPTAKDWEDPKWICHLISHDPEKGQKFIDNRLKELETYAERMKLLFSIKVCLEYAIKDLENYMEDSEYPISCCPSDDIRDAQKSIRRYKSALLKIDSAICYETDCNNIPCGSQPVIKMPHLSPHQWTLAFHIFFKILNIDTANSSQINQILIARFLHLVTGDKCPNPVVNSKYLDYLKNAPEFKRRKSKQIIEDLEAVRMHFEWIGCVDALSITDTMLAKYRRLP